MKPSFNFTKQIGFSLIELLVAMIIGLIVSLAVYTVLTTFEERKRTSTSVNDISQSNTYALYLLDKKLRSAGSGFSAGLQGAQSAVSTFGCQINVALNGVQLLPRVAAFDGAFIAVNPIVRVAPVIILDNVAGAAGAGGDVIIAMSGNSGTAETATPLTGIASANQLNVDNNINFRANDRVLAARRPIAGAMQPCLFEQVNNGFASASAAIAVALGGPYYQAAINGINLSSYLNDTLAVNLGQAPQFEMFAVGNNNTMFSYDLLRAPSALAAAPNPSTFIEGAFQMHALYGIDNDGDPNVATINWVAPTGAYASANLLAGTVAANSLLNTIKAVKIGLITRTALLERNAVSGANVTLFANTVPLVVALNDPNFRYQTSEITVPLRNTLMLENYIFR